MGAGAVFLIATGKLKIQSNNKHFDIYLIFFYNRFYLLVATGPHRA